MDIFLLLFVFPVTPHDLQDLSSQTKDLSQVRGNESTKSYPLDHQGILFPSHFKGMNHFTPREKNQE